MPKKSYQKSKDHKRMCREQVRKGMINDVDGTWKPAAQMGSGTGKNMVRDMQNGYHLNRR